MAKWWARSASGRPTSEAITLNSAFAAGVKKRILSFSSRKIVARSELFRMFSRSSDGGPLLIQGLLKLAVERRELLVERLQLLM